MGLSSLTLGIANRTSQISDLEFEICHLRSRRSGAFSLQASPLGRQCVVAVSRTKNNPDEDASSSCARSLGYGVGELCLPQMTTKPLRFRMFAMYRCHCQTPPPDFQGISKPASGTGLAGVLF